MAQLLRSVRRAVTSGRSASGASGTEAAGLAVLGTAAVVLLAVLWWQQRPAPLPDPAHTAPSRAAWSEQPPGPASPSRSPGPAAGIPGTPAAPLVVHVAGAVRAPGVYELPAGARVVDAVEAAGGLRSDADEAAVNLAQPVADGAQVRVPLPGETPVIGSGPPLSGAPGGGAEGPSAEPLDLNAADVPALEALPGVGPVTAERIVAHREQIGGFRSVDELLDVSGIGEARLAEISPHVVVR